MPTSTNRATARRRREAVSPPIPAALSPSTLPSKPRLDHTLLSFTETTETTTTHATLRFAQTSDATLGSAHTWFPANLNQAGDVWFGTSTGQPFYLTPAPGNWGQATVMHELGHAMGLKHGHQNYTNQDLRFFLDPTGANPIWGSQALPA